MKKLNEFEKNELLNPIFIIGGTAPRDDDHDKGKVKRPSIPTQGSGA